MTDEHYKKEFEKAKQKGAPKEHLDRMEFLSNGKDVHKKIKKWVNNVVKDEFWFYEKKTQKIILHKAIQQGIQIALDINKNNKEVKADE